MSKFWETTGCLNVARPKSSSNIKKDASKASDSVKLSSNRYKYLEELNVKIDLDNFSSPEFINSKYVLTSPRSLEACAQLKIKPMELLPKSLADVQEEMGGEKVPLRVIYQVFDEYEVERKQKLVLARAERDKIMGIATRPSKSLENTLKAEQDFNSNSFDVLKTLSSDAALDKTLNKLNQLKELITRHKELNDELFRQGRSANVVSSDELKSSLKREHKIDTGRVSSVPNDCTKDLESLRTSVSLTNEKLEERKKKLKQLEDIEKLIASLKEEENAKINRIIQTPTKTAQKKQAEKTLNSLSKSVENLNESRKLEAMQQLYAKNLDKLKQKTEFQMDNHTYAMRTMPEAPKEASEASFVKKESSSPNYHTLINDFSEEAMKNAVIRNHLEREAKSAKALLNAKKIEEETENYKKKKLISEIMHLERASEQRDRILREKSNKVYGNRRVRERLHDDNYKRIKEESMIRSLAKLNELQHKEIRSREFIKMKSETRNVSRLLAKSSQDLRELYKDKDITFDKMAQKAELTNLIGKGFHNGQKNTSSLFVS